MDHIGLDQASNKSLTLCIIGKKSQKTKVEMVLDDESIFTLHCGICSVYRGSNVQPNVN